MILFFFLRRRGNAASVMESFSSDRIAQIESMSGSDGNALEIATSEATALGPAPAGTEPLGASESDPDIANLHNGLL